MEVLSGALLDPVLDRATADELPAMFHIEGLTHRFPPTGECIENTIS
jgi:hypothetical protein